MGSNVSNIVIVIIIAVLLFFAIKNSIPHFKGEGGCCGGGSAPKAVKPKRIKNVIAKKTITIEGMKCANCYMRVQNELNSIDGINAKVIGSRNHAVVKLGRDISDEEIKKVITDLGYSVVSIS
ncbi:MAG: cation transporter [Lachnospiraceae bacterium]|nr:cation transporter [Lachnospiraceae bacterium]